MIDSIDDIKPGPEAALFDSSNQLQFRRSVHAAVHVTMDPGLFPSSYPSSKDQVFESGLVVFSYHLAPKIDYAVGDDLPTSASDWTILPKKRPSVLFFFFFSAVGCTEHSAVVIFLPCQRQWGNELIVPRNCTDWSPSVTCVNI